MTVTVAPVEAVMPEGESHEERIESSFFAFGVVGDVGMPESHEERIESHKVPETIMGYRVEAESHEERIESYVVHEEGSWRRVLGIS